VALHKISLVTIFCIYVFFIFSPSSRRHPYPFWYRFYNKLSNGTSIEKFMFRYLVIPRIPDNRAGHAMPAPPAAPQLGATDGDHFDACFAQQRVRVCVPVIGEAPSRRRTDQIGAAVPLRPLAYVCAPAGLDHAQLLKPKCFCNHVDEWLFVLVQVNAAWLIARPV